MTPDHPRWVEFCDRLAGPEGCDFRAERPGDPTSIAWECNGDRARSARILHAMGLTVDEVEASQLYFAAHDGGCDCEVVFHVEDAVIRVEACE